MDDIDALEQLARRMNPGQLSALVARIALRASAWAGEMAENQSRGGTVKGDFRSPVWDQDLVLALRRAASQVEGSWAADAERRNRWNSHLERFYRRGHEGFLYELGPFPELPPEGES